MTKYSAINSHTKDPQSSLVYSIEWADYLGDNTIQSSVWSVDEVLGSGGSITLDNGSLSGTVASVLVSGGIAGSTYRLSNKITLSTGEIDTRSWLIYIKDL